MLELKARRTANKGSAPSMGSEIDPGVDRGQDHEECQADRFVVHGSTLLESIEHSARRDRRGLFVQLWGIDFR